MAARCDVSYHTMLAMSVYLACFVLIFALAIGGPMTATDAYGDHAYPGGDAKGVGRHFHPSLHKRDFNVASQTTSEITSPSITWAFADTYSFEGWHATMCFVCIELGTNSHIRHALNLQ